MYFHINDMFNFNLPEYLQLAEPEEFFYIRTLHKFTNVIADNYVIKQWINCALDGA